MDCPECGEPAVAFRVPADLRAFAPRNGDGNGDGDGAAICTACLAVLPADDAPGAGEADFSRIIDAFPEGEAGAAMALATGLMVESLALNRDDVAALLEYVGDRGADPWLVLERLAAAPTVDPDADLERLRRQLSQLME